MEKTIGSGFSVINNDGHCSAILDEICKTSLPDVKMKRAEYIGKCIHVEYVLGRLIECFFFQREKERSDIFSELITNQSFFSFSVRQKIVISLIKKYPQYFQNIREKNDITKFSNKVQNIIKNRNLLAHGELVIDLKTKTIKILRYSLEDLKDESETLDSNFFKNLELDMKFVLNFCMICEIYLKHNRKIPIDENYTPIQEAFIY
jgi:hypothetical protein